VSNSIFYKHSILVKKLSCIFNTKTESFVFENSHWFLREMTLKNRIFKTYHKKRNQSEKIPNISIFCLYLLTMVSNSISCMTAKDLFGFIRRMMFYLKEECSGFFEMINNAANDVRPIVAFVDVDVALDATNTHIRPQLFEAACYFKKYGNETIYLISSEKRVSGKKKMPIHNFKTDEEKASFVRSIMKDCNGCRLLCFGGSFINYLVTEARNGDIIMDLTDEEVSNENEDPSNQDNYSILEHILLFIAVKKTMM
jgi:hypothetical protein